MAQASFEDWSKNLVAIVPDAREIDAAAQYPLWLTLIQDHDMQLKIHVFRVSELSINKVND